MKTKVSALSEVRPSANGEAVKALEGALARARAGEVIGVVILENEGRTVGIETGGDLTFGDILHAFEMYKHRKMSGESA